MFDGDADLKGLMTLFQIGDTQAGDFIYGHVDRIYGHFAALSPAQIGQFKLWYKANNEIEKACANDPALQLARYTNIKPINADLCRELATFFKGLYSQDLLGIAALREQIGEIDDHYKRFMQENRVGKCPFCGINDIKGIHHTRREAYDHYLPKGLYPFNSINFRNLAPPVMCATAATSSPRTRSILQQGDVELSIHTRIPAIAFKSKSISGREMSPLLSQETFSLSLVRQH